MGGPSWLTGIFAAASLAVAVYCAWPPDRGPPLAAPDRLDTDGAHVVMGVAMAGMLVSGLHTLPSTIWEVVFAAGAAWFGYRMYQGRRGARPSPWRSSHPLPHLVECAAMVFMFLILPASAAVEGTARGMTVTAAESRFSFLTLPLAVFLFGYVVWLGDRVTVHATRPSPGTPGHPSGPVPVWLPPGPTWPRGARRSARSPWASPWATC